MHFLAISNFFGQKYLIHFFLQVLRLHFRASTRPPFGSHFHALQEKWVIEHFIGTFWRVQGRQTPYALKL